MTLNNPKSEEGQDNYQDKKNTNLFKTMRVWVIECRFL